jgi:copper homeostasis protein
MKSFPILEACVERTSEAVEAWQKGAHQLEICSQLSLDGLTPDESTVNEIVNKVNLPCKVMIRCRAGDFEYTNDEINTMMAQIQKLKSFRIDGFVFGAVTKNLSHQYVLDIKAIYQICKAAFPIPVTIHKAIDLCFDIIAEVEVLKNISNVHYILSSGGAADAYSGAEMLYKMQKAAGSQIDIIAAEKITTDNIHLISAKTKLKIYHGRKIV